MAQARVLQVKVIPRARRTALAGEMADGTWKIQIAAAPEQGAANQALCEFLAAHFQVPKSGVTILSGQTSTRKVVRIEQG